MLLLILSLFHILVALLVLTNMEHDNAAFATPAPQQKRGRQHGSKNNSVKAVSSGSCPRRQIKEATDKRNLCSDG